MDLDLGWIILLLVLCACVSAIIIYKKRENDRQAFLQAQVNHYAYYNRGQ